MVVYYKVPNVSIEQATVALGKSWGWMIAAGLALVAMGIVSLLLPVLTTLGVTLTLAALLSARGIIELIHGFQLRRHQGAIMRFFQALLAIAAGGYFFVYPDVGTVGLSFMLCLYFFIGAGAQWILANAMGPSRARMWMYMGCLGSALLGIYIVMTLPLSAFWVPGVLLGVEFVLSGTGLIGFAVAVRNLYRQSQGLDRPDRGPTTWRPLGSSI